tara:strand:+ start:441 stop:869 length:429 start_codon:yes stop_codon:yes gene_type:complete
MTSLRQIIGGFSLHGKRVTAHQAIVALIARVDDLEADQFAHIGALHALGAGRCDTTGEWFRDAELIRAGDRCQSLKAFDPDHFFSEFDDEEQGNKNLIELFREIQSRGLTKLLVKFPRDETGTLIEPYLSAYRAAARQGGVK